MSRKFLFASVAFSALFAACSNEAILDEQVVVGQENRPMTNVALSFDEENVSLGLDAESRAYFGQNGGYQWIFEDDDKIGGLLMDTWDGIDCGIKHFNLTDYVHTNYAFIRETGADGKSKWVTPLNAPVCEGNYFFYFPYNNKMVHRGHVAWNINPEQKNYSEDGKHWPMQAVKDNQKWLGYKFVGHEAEGAVNKINFDFVPLFAMPTFDIINKAADLTVNKLVVRVSSNRSNDNINLNGTHDLMATTMVLAPKSQGFDQVNTIWEENDFKWHTSKMWYNAQAYTDFGYENESYVWPVGDPSARDMRWAVGDKPVFPITVGNETWNMAPTYEYTALFNNYKVKQMGHIQAMLVMPAGIYAYGAEQTFEALVYVTSEEGDEYVVRIDLGKPQTQGGTNNSAHDDINSAAANKYLKAGQITKFTADFDASALQSYNITDFKVTNSTDLQWIVEEAIESNGSDTGIYDLNITTTGSRVVLTPAIEKLLNARPNVRLHINGEITIGEGTTENAINLLWFNNPNMKTKLNIINKQVKKVAEVVDPTTGKVSNYAKLDNCTVITIEEKGDLNTEAVTVIATERVVNNGKLTAADIYSPFMVNNGDVTAKNITVNEEDNEENRAALLNNGKLVAKTIDGIFYNFGDATVITADVVRNEGTLAVNNIVRALSNKETGIATLNGGDVKNCVNRGGLVNVTGDTYMYYGYNDGGTMNIEAFVVVGEYFKNLNDEHETKAIVNIKATGKLYANIEEAYVENYEFTVMNVEGELSKNVQNSGEIFVIGDGQVKINGSIEKSEYNGIIDVTQATGNANDAQKATDLMTQQNRGNHFRYFVSESTNNEELQTILDHRISSYNIFDNLITIVFEKEGEIEYYGQFSTSYKVYHVVVAENTTLKIKGGSRGANEWTSFMTLSNSCGTQDEYKAFLVEDGAKMIVSDFATFKVNGIDFYVEGIFNANGQSYLRGNADVKGDGQIWIASKDSDWTTGNFTGLDK